MRQNLLRAAPANVELRRDLAQRPLLDPVVAMQFADLIRRENGMRPVCRSDQKVVLFKIPAERRPRLVQVG